MCGRMNVTDSPLNQWVSETFGINFKAKTNTDLRPSQTVAEKMTFKQAFSLHRCLIPCSGWYEWRAEMGAKKTKYLFTQADKTPLLMAGICFEYPLGGAGDIDHRIQCQVC